MKVERIECNGYEEVHLAEDAPSGLRAIIAIHSTRLGPSCGGIRCLPYASREEALKDVLLLAKGMSYKSALAGINFGGGKSVILSSPAQKTSKMFQAFGEVLNLLKGRYVAAKDMNIDPQDLKAVRQVSPHVLGVEGQPGTSGDPSPMTARGVIKSILATVRELNGGDSLAGVKIVVQGIGHVGWGVVERAKKLGAEVWVCDADRARVERAVLELGARSVELDRVYDLPCDFFSPCARGGILNAKTIPRLKCRAVVGAANNQLEAQVDGFRLHERGILYAPDYLVNAGGIINIFVEHLGYSEAEAQRRTDAIYDTLTKIYSKAKAEKTAPFVVADRLAEERLHGAK